MKKNKPSHKPKGLSLSTETVRSLNARQLDVVAGGITTITETMETVNTACNVFSCSIC